jgi:hypothetical protein
VCLYYLRAKSYITWRILYILSKSLYAIWLKLYAPGSFGKKGKTSPVIGCATSDLLYRFWSFQSSWCLADSYHGIISILRLNVYTYWKSMLISFIDASVWFMESNGCIYKAEHWFLVYTLQQITSSLALILLVYTANH